MQVLPQALGIHKYNERNSKRISINVTNKVFEMLVKINDVSSGPSHLSAKGNKHQYDVNS